MSISEALAQIQPLLANGYDCRLSPEVAREIAVIVRDHHDNREDLLAALNFVAQLRAAAGDQQGALMQPALLERVRQLVAYERFAYALLEAAARDGLGPAMRETMKSAPAGVRRGDEANKA